MNFPDGLFNAAWLWAGYAIYLPLLVVALLRVPWPQLRDNTTMHLFLGSGVGLMVLWVLKAGIAPGLNLHLLGATWFTLVFGWPLAVLGMSLVLLGITIVGMSGWSAFALNALVLVLVPVSTSHALNRLVERWLPRQLFVYLFGSGFFNAAAAVVASSSVAMSLLLVSGVYTWDHLANDYLPYALLVTFPEAFITGAGLSYLVVYHPQWVATFREDVYLGR
jgi:uncharacterized membrane protein